VDDEEGSLAHAGHALCAATAERGELQGLRFGVSQPSPPSRATSSSSSVGTGSSVRSGGGNDWWDLGADGRGEGAWPREMVRPNEGSHSELGRLQLAQAQAAAQMNVKVTHASGEEMQVVVTRKRRPRNVGAIACRS
jgi:hypothetical protein